MESTTYLRIRLADLNLAIKAQEEVLAKLRENRRDIQSQLDSVIYPILTLPNEITSEIFMHRVALSPPDEPTIRSFSPVLLLSICRAWRDIALSTPALWTTLYLDLERLAFTSKLCQFRMISRVGKKVGRFLDTRVSRARSCPLSVTLRGDVFECLGKQQSLDLEIDADGLRKLNEVLCQSGKSLHWHLLQKLSIIDHHSSKSTDIREVFSEARTPRLRVLDLAGCIVRCSVDVKTWGKLTRFSGYADSLRECATVFLQAINLVECTFHLGDQDSDEDDFKDTISHTHLQSLTLHGGCYGDSCATELIQLLILPALRTLIVYGLEHLDRELFTKAPLGKFPNMPELTELKFDAAGQGFIRDFIPHLEDPGVVFLPGLQQLSFVRYRSPTQSDFEMMARAVSSRINHSRDGVAEIRSFSIWLANNETDVYSDEFYDIVSPLYDLGIDVRVL
ncbi:hypothetical protein B0H10DRAFT_2040144 [Mycena sp. CBHHK59/15]|nr:hypothetical protein B0H10DRAFT_2040144 [Mycena sp. CBHHK59/15]